MICKQGVTIYCCHALSVFKSYKSRRTVMKSLYIVLFSTAFLFTESALSAQDDQQEKINTILETLAAQEEVIEKLKNTLLPNIQPVGSLIFMASEKPPAGYLYCDGSVRSRTEFKELFEAIGETWGKGDGSTTFNLPDLRGEFIRVWSKDSTVDAGRRVGQAQGQSTAMPNARFATADAGEHGHSLSVSSDQSTKAAGDHSHTGMKAAVTTPGTLPSVPDGRIVAGIPQFFSRGLGEHSHTVPSHSHQLGAASNHTHNIIGGDAETRPRNQALACFIKAFSNSAF
jgi:microcystin-dependent protein